MTASNNSISEKLLHWYDVHARSLPWRNPPGAVLPDEETWPYRVWLSEVMLQQTTVAAVKPYFEEFTARWPDVEALAQADEADVMSAWAGLGYYSRARNLVKCARQVAAMGGFPDDEDGLRNLPGLGAYTAAAIAAIGFGRRAVVVDANVERVVARLFAISEPLPAARKAIREQTDCVTPDQRSGDFAQAMMDLGSRICTSRDPKCLLCPLNDDCAGRAAGDPSGLPVKPPKKVKPKRVGQAFWIERNNAGVREVWLITRAPLGMLGGMRAFPDDGWSAQTDGSGSAPFAGEWEAMGAVTHVFTHAHLTLSLLRSEQYEWNGGDGQWWPVDQLDEAGLPTLFAKAARLALT